VFSGENAESRGRISHRTRPWSTAKRGAWPGRGALGFGAGFVGCGQKLANARAAGYGGQMRLEAVREQLSGYRAADATEASYVARMIALTLSTQACERSHFVPGHFTASAFVLSPDRRDLILIHHKKLGIWVQPGGHVEPTDAGLVSAARREVAEEVGLGELDSFAKDSALFDVDIHSIPARKSEPAHEHFDARFAFVARTRDFARTEEVADVRWVPLARVSETTADESVLRAARKLLAADRQPE
jgi:8-oxo-dGTP pyrophosphatase MutT (NUDIX family)